MLDNRDSEEFDGYEELSPDQAGRVAFNRQQVDLFRFETQSVIPEKYSLISEFERYLGEVFLYRYGRYLDQEQVEYFLGSHINFLNIEDSIIVDQEYNESDIQSPDYYYKVAIQGKVFLSYSQGKDIEPSKKSCDDNTSKPIKPKAGFLKRVGRVPVLVNRWPDNVTPNIEYLKFEGSPSIDIASTIIHEKLHGGIKSILPLPIEEIVIRYYISELFKGMGWQLPNFGAWRQAVEFFENIVNQFPNQEDLHLFFFGNVNSVQKEEAILLYLKNVFTIDQIQRLLPRIQWETYELSPN